MAAQDCLPTDKDKDKFGADYRVLEEIDKGKAALTELFISIKTDSSCRSFIDKVQGFCANKRKTLAALFSTHYLKALSKRILCNFIKNSKIPEQSGPHIFIANILGHCKGGANLVAGISNA